MTTNAPFMLSLTDLGSGRGVMLSEQVMRKSWKDVLTKKMTCCWSCLGEVVVRRLVPQDMVPIGRSTDKSTHARTAAGPLSCLCYLSSADVYTTHWAPNFPNFIQSVTCLPNSSRCGVTHNETYRMLSSGVLVTHD
jgi:hypothetical protein